MKAGKVSVSSPIARAIIGSRKATSSRSRRAGGARSYEIDKVRSPANSPELLIFKARLLERAP
ncbi:MAG: hypothetical protein R3C40_10985 [Parvularculaceae bacterium]